MKAQVYVYVIVAFLLLSLMWYIGMISSLHQMDHSGRQKTPYYPSFLESYVMPVVTSIRDYFLFFLNSIIYVVWYILVLIIKFICNIFIGLWATARFMCGY